MVYAALGALGLVCATLLSGCLALGALAGAWEKTGSHTVEPKYNGLTGKSFAVIVAADPSIQADFPQLVGQVTATVSERLKEKVGASGYIPAEAVLGYRYQHPRWAAMSQVDLAKELGVDRLIFVDIHEFRLTDPGNQYLWAGLASGSVGVWEADSALSESAVFTENISVTFPTKDEGKGPQEIPRDNVQIILAKRFIDRASWLFYTHDEPNVIEY
jgi:hypothetical protein